MLDWLTLTYSPSRMLNGVQDLVYGCEATPDARYVRAWYARRKRGMRVPLWGRFLRAWHAAD